VEGLEPAVALVVLAAVVQQMLLESPIPAVAAVVAIGLAVPEL
jgi:hypothetical protein